TCALALSGGMVEVEASRSATALSGLGTAHLDRNLTGVYGACSGLAEEGTVTVTDRNGVAGVQCPGCEADGSYRLESDYDALRVLYTGFPHAGSIDCNSDARHALAIGAGQFLEGCAAAAATTPLRHIYRTADGAPGTQALLDDIDLPFATWCN